MKSIRPIVEVMNLFSLVRINAAKKKVDEFGITSSVLTSIISSIIYNDNIVFDKNSIDVDITKPVLDIYIASDFGFCSSYNSSVSSKIKENKENWKIIIGKKITYNDDKVVMRVAKNDFYEELGKIREYIVNALNNKMYSKINIYYNHYYNYSRSEFTSMQVFPVEYGEEYKEDVDFLVETDITDFINNLISYYVCYELEICEIFSWASENVIRNTTTSESLRKIDELEHVERLNALRKKREESLKKNIDNAKKLSYIYLDSDEEFC